MIQPLSALILVVEDDAAMRGAVWRLLAAERYHVRTFGSVEDLVATDVLGSAACVVADIELGEGLSGLDLADLLARAERPVPVVLMTAHADAGRRRRAAELGCELFEKPFEGADLLAAVARAIEP